MEILLLAAIAWAMGQQSEQSKLGLTPAHRAHMKEKHRHEKALRRIAEKHGPPPPMPAPLPGVSPWKEAPATDAPSGPVPDTFLSGYRNHRPARPPFGHRVGVRTGSAVAWAQHTGRDAWHAYRERRRAAGHDDPGPVLVPAPPTGPPAVPPIPKHAPTVHEKPEPTAGPDPPQTEESAPDETPEAKPEPAAIEETVEPPAEEPEKAAEVVPDDGEDWASAYAWTDEDKPQAAPVQTPAADTAPKPDTKKEATPAVPESGTAPTGNGVGRMAAEVTYESVMDESDELSLMCEDDVRVYGRIRARAEREIGRGDDLIAKLEDAGFGPKVIGWVTRCKEQYQVIHSQLDDLEKNTIAQGEAVAKAKTLLEHGQGLYAGIAKDMESVATRESYVSDAIDAEDANPEAEHYETKAA